MHAFLYAGQHYAFFIYNSNMLVCNEFLDVCMPAHMHARMCVCVRVRVFNQMLIQYDVRACVFMPPVFHFHPDSSRCRYASHPGPHHSSSALEAAFS